MRRPRSCVPALTAAALVAPGRARQVLNPVAGQPPTGAVPQSAWAAMQGQVAFAVAGSSEVWATDGRSAAPLADAALAGTGLCRLTALRRWASGHLSEAGCHPDRSAADDADRGSAWCAPTASAGKHSLSIMLPVGTRLAAVELAARCAQPLDRTCFQWATAVDAAVWDGRGWASLGTLSGPPHPGGGTAAVYRVMRTLSVPVEARILRVTPQTWYRWPSLRLDAYAACAEDAGSGRGPYSLSLYPLPGRLGIEARRRGAAPRLLGLDAAGVLSELWRCDGRNHPLCEGGSGAPAVGTPAPGGAQLPQPLLRPAGTGQLLALGPPAGGFRALRDAGEWRGTALAVNLPTAQLISDLTTWEQEGDLGAAEPVGRLAAWSAPYLGRSRLEGAAVAKLECDDDRLYERRQVYLTYSGGATAAIDALMGPPGAVNSSWAETTRGKCATIPDFAGAREGSDCVNAAADGVTATEWGHRLGAHIRFDSTVGEATPASCASSLFPNAGGLRVRVDPSGHETDPRRDWYAVLHGTVYFRSHDPLHGMELWAWEPGMGISGAGALTPPPCQEAEMDGSELTYAMLPEGAGFDPSDFVLEVEVFPLQSPVGTLVAQLGSGAPGELWSWRTGGYNVSSGSNATGGVGIAVPTADGCSVLLPVGVHPSSLLELALPDYVGGCSPHPAEGADAGQFAATVYDGTLLLRRTDSENGWNRHVTLRCWRQDCIGGALAAAPPGIWTTIRWECSHGVCAVYENGALLGAGNVTAAQRIPGRRSAAASSVLIGAMREGLSRGLTDTFRGGIRNLRLNGACLQPDYTRHSQGGGCYIPEAKSSGVNATAALRGAGDGLVWRHDGATYSWPPFVQWDYGEVAAVTAVEWACAEEYGCPSKVRVQRSADASKWATVATATAKVWNASYLQSHRVEDRSGTPARYWRVLIDAAHGAPLTQNGVTGEAAVDMLRLGAECGVNAARRARLAADTLPGPDSGDPLAGVVLGGTLLFFASADVQLYHLTRYAPSSGARRVTDRLPQRFASAAGPSAPGGAVLQGLHCAVWAVRGGLLVSDGTEHGTRMHPAPPPDTSEGRSHLAVLPSSAGAPARVAFFCGGAAQPAAARSMESAAAQSALCIALVRSPHDVSVTLLPIGRGSIAAVPGTGFAVVSSPGLAGDALQPVWRSLAAAPPLGDFRALGDGGCSEPAADATLDTEQPAYNMHAGFLSVRSDAARAAVLRFEGAPTQLTELRLRLYGVAADWEDVPGSCESLVVEAIDPSWTWAEKGISGGDTAGAVIATATPALPATPTGDLDLDISDLISAHANYTAAGAYAGPLQLRLRLDPNQCQNRSMPYTMVFQPRECETPRERPQLCTRGNTLRYLSRATPLLPSAPPTASRGYVQRAVLLSESATTEDWLYASCGGATVRFKPSARALRYLQTGGSPAGWEPIRDAQVVAGSVRHLPDSLWAGDSEGDLGGAITLSSVQHGAVFMSTHCQDSEPCCNGALPGAADEAVLQHLQPRAPHRVFTLPRCNAAECEASGGVCGEQGCECPSESMVGGSGRCECAQWWYGPRCDVYCNDAVSCSGRGVCDGLGNCECDAGWGGPECAEGLSCAGLKALLPAAVELNCAHLPEGEVLTAGAGADDAVIDRCNACVEEGVVNEKGTVRYQCTFV
eukprot:TRINITY_DN1688_c0_g1_i1.p1 TRINITY_DN1688_c0_g1~~TRINITY_DN1688_c0_g1_i1.p1  ORF type:complete len:1681 (+),score=396.64 TRINITY_DN1688_c0_g1_i1:84-5045(+)